MDGKGSTIKLALKGGDFLAKANESKIKPQLKDKVEAQVTDTPASKASLAATPTLSVETQFRTQITAVADDLNRRFGQLQQTKDSLRSEKKSLKDLQLAFIDGDDEDVAEAQNSLKEAKFERKQNQSQIEREQKLSSEEKIINLGKQQQAKVNVPKIALPELQEEIPSDLNDVTEQLVQVSLDLDSIRAQKQKLDDARNQLAETLKLGRANIESSGPRSLKTLDDAEQFADEISSEVRGLSRDQLVSSVANKIDPFTVSQVLRG